MIQLTSKMNGHIKVFSVSSTTVYHISDEMANLKQAYTYSVTDLKIVGLLAEFRECWKYTN